MNYKIYILLGILFIVISLSSLHATFTGEKVLVQTEKLNEITGKYEPRYYESNTNALFTIPAIIFGVLGIVFTVVGLVNWDIRRTGY